MDVLTSETCWALNNEIIKQVTSSWSLFTQHNWSILLFIKEIKICSRYVQKGTWAPTGQDQDILFSCPAMYTYWRDRQTERETERQTYIHTERDRYTERQTGIQRDRQRQTYRERDRQTYRETDRQRQTDRETDRQTYRETDRQRQTDRHTESKNSYIVSTVFLKTLNTINMKYTYIHTYICSATPVWCYV